MYASSKARLMKVSHARSSEPLPALANCSGDSDTLGIHVLMTREA